MVNSGDEEPYSGPGHSPRRRQSMSLAQKQTEFAPAPLSVLLLRPHTLRDPSAMDDASKRRKQIPASRPARPDASFRRVSVFHYKRKSTTVGHSSSLPNLAPDPISYIYVWRAWKRRNVNQLKRRRVLTDGHLMTTPRCRFSAGSSI